MRFRICLTLLLASLATASPGLPAAAAPNDDNCRAAINSALDTLRRQPSGQPRDEADRQRLLADMQRLVEDNRRQGVPECQTWTQLMGKAANQ